MDVGVVWWRGSRVRWLLVGGLRGFLGVGVGYGAVGD